jgi:transposase-like protein
MNKIPSAVRVLSVLEKAKVVCWFEETASLAMVARRYRSEFGMEPPKLSQIKKWHSQFMQTGSIGPFEEALTTSAQTVEMPAISTKTSQLVAETAINGRFMEPRL